jgi:hypothetical protein
MDIGLLVGVQSAEDRMPCFKTWRMAPWISWWAPIRLFSKGVTYAYLGLAIIDEQHKFGVNQRSLAPR